MQHNTPTDRLISIAKAAQSAKSLEAVRILQQQLDTLKDMNNAKESNHRHAGRH